MRIVLSNSILHKQSFCSYIHYRYVFISFKYVKIFFLINSKKSSSNCQPLSASHHVQKNKARYNQAVILKTQIDENRKIMKRSSHLARRMTALNRTRRRRTFMKALKQRRLARAEVFFLLEDNH